MQWFADEDSLYFGFSGIGDDRNLHIWLYYKTEVKRRHRWPDHGSQWMLIIFQSRS